MKRLIMALNGQVIGHLDEDAHGAVRVTVSPPDGIPRLSPAFEPAERPI